MAEAGLTEVRGVIRSQVSLVMRTSIAAIRKARGQTALSSTRFVEIRGGAYFFPPGIAAIRMLAELKECAKQEKIKWRYSEFPSR